MRDEKEVVDELRGQVDQYQKILHNLHEGYILVDEDANIHDVNPAYCNMVGYSREELLSMKLTEVRPGMSLAYQQEFIEKAIKEGSKEFETQHRRKDGQMIDLNASAAAIEKDGKIYLASFVRDITDRKKMLENLEKSEQRFKSLFRHNPHSVYLMDLEGNYLDLNSKIEELTGYTKEEMLKMNFAPLITERDLPKTQDNFEKAVSGEIREYEITCITKKGQEKPIHVTNFPMIIGDEIVGVFGIAEDLTEKKEAERQRRESEQRFQSLFKHNPHPVYYFDLEGNFKEVNQKLVEFTGHSRDELLQLGFEHFIDEDDLERTKEHFRRATEGGSGTYEISVWVQDGIKKEIRVTKFPMYVNEEIVGVYGILQDITEQKKIARNLKESEERWHRLVEENPKPVQITIDGDIVFINEAGAKLYEAGSAEELIGKSVFEFTHPDDIEEVKKRKNKLEKDIQVDRVHVNRIITCAGNERFVEVHSVSIIYKGRRAIQTNIYDITNRKKEEAIIQASLKEKQILLQEIHHRVKNNMAVISGLLELQAMNTENESLRSILKESKMRIYSMAMIHEKLYASKSLAAIKFDEYARELVEVIMRTMSDINTEVAVRFRIGSGELNITQAIPCGLILNELVVNCYKHAFTKQKTGSILVGFLKDNDKVTISVEDNGKGLPGDFNIEQQQSLGMKIIRTLVKQLEGDIDIQSGQDQAGVCFIISFKEDQ
ncbi:MAG: PAS domain S-box protein [Balneolaceae bacterium]|nr:PAS domain S-box protein [Balneolaceae bacterium]